ncbi:MAG TPA: hypothetical protein DEG88_10515 [Propionibacteriaceae bacterium]|nr:hypothetical protein [Propionibacteriaceae bacterium]
MPRLHQRRVGSKRGSELLHSDPVAPVWPFGGHAGGGRDRHGGGGHRALGGRGLRGRRRGVGGGGASAKRDHPHSQRRNSGPRVTRMMHGSSFHGGHPPMAGVAVSGSATH